MEPPKPPERCKREKPDDVPAHRIVVLPEEVTAFGFKYQTLPVVLCTHCDGGAHARAIRAYDRRNSV